MDNGREPDSWRSKLWVERLVDNKKEIGRRNRTVLIQILTFIQCLIYITLLLAHIIAFDIILHTFAAVFFL